MEINKFLIFLKNNSLISIDFGIKSKGTSRLDTGG